MPTAWPRLPDVLAGAAAYVIRLRVPFRGLTERRGLLVHGPSGWGEFAPFDDYDLTADARWLAAAIEAGWGEWPAARRDVVPVNAIVPAVGPDQARDLVRASDCSTVKVKVGQIGHTLADDVERVGAVRDALGVGGRIRIDANGAWSVEQAVRSLTELEAFGLEYVEQPCATVAELGALRRLIGLPVAIDEGIRRAPDPLTVEGVREAADLLVLKAAPLGGVVSALRVAEAYGLPVVVSSALESSVGLGAGVALAAALPELPYACGLNTGQLLAADVSRSPVLARGGVVDVRRVQVEPSLLDAVSAPADEQRRWRARATVAYQALAP